MAAADKISPAITDFEGIDFEKLKVIFRKNLVWVILLILSANIAAYLTIRWTKDLYESESELKLEFKSAAPEFGFSSFVEDANINFISGEIELIKSKLFFSKVIERADINVSYFSIGNILNYEMYKSSPFKVDYKIKSGSAYDIPFYFNFINGNAFKIRIGDDKKNYQGNFGEWLDLGVADIMVTQKPDRAPGDDNDYFFVINSQERLLQYLASNITVEPLKVSANTIRIAFKDNNAHKAFELVSLIDSLYLDYSYQQKNLANLQKIEWLNSELRQIESRLEEFENYFEKFTLSNRTSDLNDDLKRTILLMNKIDSQRFELNKRIVELNKIIEGVTSNSEVELLPGQLVYFPLAIQKDLETYVDLLQRQRRTSLTYSENTFAFRQNEAQMGAVKSKIFNTLIDFRERWTARMLELNNQKRALENQFAALPGKSTELGKNQRFYKLYEEFYLAMMQSKAQFEIAQAGSTPDFKIFAPATMPKSPISPNKLIIAGIGVVGGGVLAFFFIGFAYILNNKITSLAELERISNVPILGTVPELKGLSPENIYVKEQPMSMLSESIRTLRTNLDFFAVEKNKKVIVVTSTVSGEGKSFISINLGAVVAMSNKKVLLIDADMRKQKKALDRLNGEKGLSTVLVKKFEWKECIHATELEGLDFMPSGPHPPNPSELLLGKEFEILLKELKTNYDFILIDTPPAGLVTDAIMVIKQADLCIYLLRVNYSQRTFLTNLNRLQSINKFNHITTVLNALPITGRRYGSYYYEQKSKRNLVRNILKV